MINRNFKINDFDLYDPPSDLVENSNYYYSLLRKNNPVHKKQNK